MPLHGTPLNELAQKLERDLERQDRLFRSVRESLAQLGGETRLSIPDAVLEELDAAFAPPPAAAPDGPLTGLRVRA
jgi:hypothetical protein